LPQGQVQKKLKALVFEATDCKAVCTSVGARVSHCTVKVQVTSKSTTYRTTPIAAERALTEE